MSQTDSEPTTDEILVCSTASGNRRVLHEPGEDGEPACGCATAKNRTWVKKPANVYPVGYYDRCKRCQAILEGQDDA